MVTTAGENGSGAQSGALLGRSGTGPGLESGASQDWLSVTEAAVRAGVQERSIRRMIARGAVVSKLREDGRRLVLAESLPGPGRGQGPVTVPGQDSDSGNGQGPGPDSGPDPVREQLARESAMVDFLKGQLQQSRDAERELRLLLAQATKTAQLLATPAALPAPANCRADNSSPRLRWFRFWGRRA